MTTEMFGFNALSQFSRPVALLTVADGVVIYAKVRAFKDKATNSRPRPRPDNPRPTSRASNLALRPRPKINI